MPNPVDFSIESGRNHERRELPYDLFYACGNENDPRGLCGQDVTARELLALIERRAPGIRILSPGARGAPNIAGAKYQAALELAAVGLNLSRRNDVYLYSSDRLAHLTGNGLAVLMERSNGYEEFIPEGEFVYFASRRNDREAAPPGIGDTDSTASASQRRGGRATALFNEQTVAKYIVEVGVFGRFDPFARSLGRRSTHSNPALSLTSPAGSAGCAVPATASPSRATARPSAGPRRAGSSGTARPRAGSARPPAA